MNYQSSKDAALRWGMSLRRAQALLRQGRVAGALMPGRDYLVPISAARPEKMSTAPHRKIN